MEFWDFSFRIVLMLSIMRIGAVAWLFIFLTAFLLPLFFAPFSRRTYLIFFPHYVIMLKTY